MEQSVTLDEVTKNILGEKYFNGLQKFLMPHLMEKEKETYTLFITRRCSCLAYIFKRISEDLNGKKIELKQNHLLTNSALINAASSIAKEVLQGKEPDIFLVDDSISYGRALTNILDLFIYRFTKVVREEKGDQTDAVVREYMKNHIKIHVYLKKNHHDLLSRTYRNMTTAQEVVVQSVWNDFSTRVSELINNADIANAAFVYSAGIDKIPQTISEQWRTITTNYYEHKQTTFFRAFPSEENIKAICAIRCFPCSVNVKYRIVPFIFLPNLKEEELKRLEERVFRKLMSKIKLKKTNEDFLRCYQKSNTLRSRAEFVTMYISQSLLISFICDKCKNNPKLDQYDCEKVNWTYFYCDKDQNDFFSWIDLNNPELWFTEEEISNLILVSIDELLFREVQYGSQQIPFYAQSATKDQLTKLEMNFESLLFDRAVDSEKKSHDLAEKQFFLLNSQRFTSDPDRRYQLGEFEKDISKQIDDQYSLVQLLAITLQMMDAGLMSIVTRDVADDVYGGNGTYHVLEQQVRVCEQALCSYPRRYYKYKPMIENILKVEDCDWTDYETFMIILQYQIGLKLKKELQKTGLTEQDITEILPQLKKMLLLFKKSFQKMSYWDESIIRRFAVKTLEDEPFEIPIPKGIKCISGNSL